MDMHSAAIIGREGDLIIEKDHQLLYNKDELKQTVFDIVDQVLSSPELDNRIGKNRNEPSCTLSKITLSVEETADILGISRASAYELAKRKDFPSFRIGNRILVKRVALEQWLEAQ